MMKPEFRKQEQKKFIEKVATLKLSPQELIFEKRDEKSYQFRYLDSGIVFIMNLPTERFDKITYEYTLYTPTRKRVTYLDKDYYLTDVLNNFEKWLKEHVLVYKNEMTAPDPWQIFVANFSENDGYEKFTAEEIEYIEAGLDNFPKFLLQKSTIHPDKQIYILDEIKELKKDLHNKPKRKWAKRLTLFIIEEVWDAVKDQLVMNEVKKYFFQLVGKSLEYLPKILTLLP
ncbi:hypothetical protein [Pseudochryseolinea flava]|uniref:Uncharacterized protein n=1 Tax=Pseudochryseolinea flava TaxID=2059302 RepID=A0A364Y643_9BACT|nr:hypothetical protein [Pseudochryseolinea flava]RAW01578.1 hypothetical protein DQQ10_07925 [Pseudochryseolinea flava]